MIRATTKLEKQQCRVRSSTDDPCLRPAALEVSGVPFCELCAREQETYFAIGKITEASSQRLDEEELLVDMLESMRRIRRRRHIAGTHEPDAA